MDGACLCIPASYFTVNRIAFLSDIILYSIEKHSTGVNPAGLSVIGRLFPFG